ncbi:MAG TPA: phosphatidate cytidylyltransferase, partial [Erysipelothrix sp.]|nr:phosphatidate cytidylyltransferase [Erysipelothrix sp.]
FGGSLFGKHKLIERISPNKTVEGAITGYIASVILSLLFARIFIELDQTLIYSVSFIIPIISQLGDLTFSMIKRHYGIKDFGYIFPGHGGVLDRIDSIIFSLIAFNMLYIVLG